MLPHIKSGRLRALGVTGAKGSPELPGVPTISDAGVNGFVMVAWFGIVGPKGLPRDIQMKLHGDLLRVLVFPEIMKGLAAAGQEITWQETPDRFFDFMKTEAVKWARAVKDSGAQAQ
jgi:tripartite-type tricarboxylate transporter receptor subunit TctC